MSTLSLPRFSAQPLMLRKRMPDQPLDIPMDVSSETLLAGRREILIRHGDRVYRLRHTSNDKLILTK